MSTNQKYSSRIHTRRQLVSVDTHLGSCINLLNDVGHKYEDVLPQVSEACLEMINILGMVTIAVEQVRDSI